MADRVDNSRDGAADAAALRDERIERRKLSDAVFDRLKALILGGELPVGALLPSERELMDRLGVGRPAVREAMQALAGLGLISISHGERARVRQLTADSLFRQIDLPAQLMLSASSRSLRHLLDARAFFERGMVREAAARATQADVARLSVIIEAQRQASADIPRFIERDMEFHTEIASIAGNPILQGVSRAMLGWLRQYHVEMLHWSGNETVTVAEHGLITERIAANDPEGAECQMISHLARSRALFVHRDDR